MNFRQIAIILPLALSGCALTELIHYDRAWPDPNASFALKGPLDSIQITRDDLGIPHVRAQNEHDLWFGVGFAVGQDRFFQADLFRQFFYGHVAEWMGKDAVASDALMRAFQLRDHAHEMFIRLDGPVQAMLQAYADGMNAGLASLPADPLEYRVLGVTPRPWEPEDCYTILYMMSWTLAENPEYEIAAWKMRSEADASTLSRLFSWSSPVAPVDPYWDDARKLSTGPFIDGLDDAITQLGINPSQDIAGNAWVIGGSKTKSGLPIVANDPHLPQMVPSIWYPIDAKAGPLHITGASFAGLPGVIIGHNEHVAFALNNIMADVIDLAIVQLTDDGHYILGGEKKPLIRKTFALQVHGGADRSRTMYLTELGPLITEIGTDYALAMQWHAASLIDRTPWVMRALSLTSSVDQVMLGTQQPMMVAQLLTVADDSGSYAVQGIGAVPVRQQYTGRVPYPAFEMGNGWTGWNTQLPGSREVDDDYLVSANTAPPWPHHAMGSPLEHDAQSLSSSWAPSVRFHRISAMLAPLSVATPADMHTIQLDDFDTFARDFLPPLIHGVRVSDAAQPCLDAVATWDYHWRKDSKGAAVWAVLQRHLLYETLQKTLSPEAIDTYLHAVNPSRSLLLGDFSSFIHDRETTVAQALSATCDALRHTLGKHDHDWTWGDLHRLRLQHPFAVQRPILHRWNMPDVPIGGAGTTVMSTNFSFDVGLKPVQSLSSFRIVMPLDDLGATTFVHPGGASGHPRHPDASNQFDAYVQGKALPLYAHDADVNAHAEGTLHLIPK